MVIGILILYAKILRVGATRIGSLLQSKELKRFMSNRSMTIVICLKL